MKIGKGFISNSSSTSFLFCTKESGVNHLCSMINKYKNHFDLEINPHWLPIDLYKEGPIKITAQDVIKSIKEADFISVPIGAAIEDEKTYCINYEDKLQSLKKRNFNYVAYIEFGDHHGDICENKVGHIMNYTGQWISLKEDDFYILVRQDR